MYIAIIPPVHVHPVPKAILIQVIDKLHTPLSQSTAKVNMNLVQTVRQNQFSIFS